MNKTLEQCDVLIKGARVIDPAASVDATLDIALIAGKIAALAPSITAKAEEVFEANGKIAIPGIIDIHAHPYPFAHWGLDPDTVGVFSGVATVFDGGSSGVMTFNHFLENYIKKAVTDVYAFLHMHPAGEVTLPEIWDKDKVILHPEAIIDTVKRNRGRIVGIKDRAIGSLVRHRGPEAVTTALAICKECAVPLMVHIGLDPGDDLPEDELDAYMRCLLENMRPGDIITHAFTGKRGRIFREDGLYDDLIKKAVARGVILDACVGRTNISWDALRIARARGYAPQALGTDLTTFGMENAGKNMGVTMSKLMAAGLTFMEVVTLVTSAPASIMGMPEKGTLAVDTCADITLLDVAKGRFEFLDRFGGEKITGDTLIAPFGVFKRGSFIKATVTGGPTH
ncbi:amidohydrolase family protein [Desulfovibrio sp. OttesenSCG-928-O18]|nr:amidohydrolase family protein [Desulfovibrio sp. OttesenSCG-928-O18]